MEEENKVKETNCDCGPNCKCGPKCDCGPDCNCNSNNKCNCKSKKTTHVVLITFVVLVVLAIVAACLFLLYRDNQIAKGEIARLNKQLTSSQTGTDNSQTTTNTLVVENTTEESATENTSETETKTTTTASSSSADQAYKTWLAGMKKSLTSLTPYPGEDYLVFDNFERYDKNAQTNVSYQLFIDPEGNAYITNTYPESRDDLIWQIGSNIVKVAAFSNGEDGGNAIYTISEDGQLSVCFDVNDKLAADRIPVLKKVDNLKNIVDVIQTPASYAMSAYFIDIEGNIHSAYAYKD